MLFDAYGVSDDGLTIVGIGENPDDNPEGWVAIIPEPGTALLAAWGLLEIASRWRRRQPTTRA